MGLCSCRAWVPVQLSQAIEGMPDPPSSRAHSDTCPCTAPWLHAAAACMETAERRPGACQAGQPEWVWGSAGEGRWSEYGGTQGWAGGGIMGAHQGGQWGGRGCPHWMHRCSWAGQGPSFLPQPYQGCCCGVMHHCDLGPCSLAWPCMLP